jgi:hypothetical protein
MLGWRCGSSGGEPILKKPSEKAGGAAQGDSPEFKPQCLKKKKKMDGEEA